MSVGRGRAEFNLGIERFAGLFDYKGSGNFLWDDILWEQMVEIPTVSNTNQVLDYM
jgi:hypothetical protein